MCTTWKQCFSYHEKRCRTPCLRNKRRYHASAQLYNDSTAYWFCCMRYYRRLFSLFFPLVCPQSSWVAHKLLLYFSTGVEEIGPEVFVSKWEYVKRKKTAVYSKTQTGPQMNYKEVQSCPSALTSPLQNYLAQCNMDTCQKPSPVYHIGYLRGKVKLKELWELLGSHSLTSPLWHL